MLYASRLGSIFLAYRALILPLHAYYVMLDLILDHPYFSCVPCCYDASASFIIYPRVESAPQRNKPLTKATMALYPRLQGCGFLCHTEIKHFGPRHSLI